jgi:hypothetical protein
MSCMIGCLYVENFSSFSLRICLFTRGLVLFTTSVYTYLLIYN